MNRILIVGAGGFVGAVMRYGLGALIAGIAGESSLPYPTLIVNVIGCFLIGLLAYFAEGVAGLTNEMYLLLMVGLLGAFTTYSTFSYEAMSLLMSNRVGFALLHIGLHILAGLTAVWLGRVVAIGIFR